jgi:diacylglycerol kinase (ATP)
MQDSRRTIRFIVNPASGYSRNRSKEIEQLIDEHLDRTLFIPEVVFSLAPGQPLLLSRKAAEQGIDIVVAVGGDGSVNEVAKGLTGSKSTLGIIPIGSGNGLARHLGIPMETARAIEVLNSGKTMLIDTVSINDNQFVSIAGVGFDALVADKFAQAGSRGFLTYFRIATRAYPFYKPKKYILDIDGEIVKRRALFISFANSDQFGYNTTIAPTADISDGLMDVCIVQKIPMFKAPLIAHLLLAKKIDQSSYVEIIKAKQVFLRRRKNEVINIDGEPVLLSRDLSLKVNHLALRLAIP